MSTGSFDESAGRERLSALVDGELDGAGSAAACATWRSNAEARRDWHAWQLIGDVLRSDDLASDACHDASFLAGVRARLATEPVVLAPAPLEVAAAGRVGTARRSSRWMLASAMAAGFVLVVGTVAILRPAGAPASAGSALASADGSRPVATDPMLRAATVREPIDAQSTVVVDGQLIRDARLDRYLAAHKQFAGTSALGVPSAFLRSATVDSAQR